MAKSQDSKSGSTNESFILENSKDLLKKGNDFLKRGNETEALKSYSKAISYLEAHKDDISSYKTPISKIYCELALGLINVNKQNEAMRIFDKAINLDQKNVEVWIIRGKALTDLMTKMYDSALKSFNSALKLEPTNKEALASKGAALEWLNQPEMAKESYILIIDNHPEEFEIYDRILKLTPDDNTIWQRKGEALNNAKMYEEALTCYDKALQNNPNDIKLLGDRALLLGNLERFDEALAGLKEALKIDGKNVMLLKGLGHVHNKMGSLDEALEAYNHALKLNTADSDTWNHKAKVLFDLKRPAEALNAYEASHSLSPEDKTTLFNMINILKTLDRRERILDVCDKIIALDAQDIVPYIEKARVNMSMEDYGSALNIFDSALELDNKNIDVLTGKKDVLMKLGDYESANETCDRILKLDSKNVLVWVDKALSLVQIDKLDIANAAYDRALKIEPENLNLWLAKMDVLKSLNRYADVINAANIILKQRPDNIEVLLDKGFAFESLERYDEAMEVYDHILSSNPNEVSALQRKANVLFKKGQFQESEKYLGKALELEKGNKSLWNDMGLLQFKLEKFKEANESYSNALNLDSGDMEVWHNRSLVLFKLNNFEDAMDSMNQVMKLNTGDKESNEIVRRGITVELKVFMNIAQLIEDKDQRKEALSVLERAKEALKSDDYQRSHEMCNECKGMIELYTTSILEGGEKAIASLSEMGGETEEFKALYDDMKTKLADNNFSEAFPISEQLRKGVYEKQYKMVSSFFNSMREEIKDAKQSGIDIKRQLRGLSEAKELTERTKFKEAHAIIIKTQEELHQIIEKNKEYKGAINNVENQLEDARKNEVNVGSVESKIADARDALNKNDFDAVAQIVEDAIQVLKQLTMEHQINEKITKSNQLIAIASSLDMATEDAESQLEKTEQLLKSGEFEKAEATANQTLEMAEKLCNLKIMEILTQIRSRITEAKKMGLEAVTTEVLYKKTEDALMSRRYAMAAKYASLCIEEIEEIRDESQRAANILLLAGTYVQEAENINADVGSIRMLLNTAASELEDNQYTSSLEDGNRCIQLVKRAKEQRVRDIISQSREIIEATKNEGSDVFNAEMLLKEAEIVIGTEDYFKALKLALMGESEVGKSDLQKKVVPDIVNKIDQRSKDLETKGLASFVVRSHINDAREALKNREFIMAYDYAILGSRELSEIIRDYEKAAISLRAASARIHEVESIGVDLTEIKGLFERAKKEFDEGNHSDALTLVKETIENSKRTYKEYLLKPIENCESMIVTAKGLGADINRANNILLEAKAAFDEELFSQVPLFIDNCKKIVEREIKGHLFEKITQARERLEAANSKGIDTREEMRFLKSGESSLENKKYNESIGYLQKCLDGIKAKEN